jgi:hypothetical protein
VDATKQPSVVAIGMRTFFPLIKIGPAIPIGMGT